MVASWLGLFPGRGLANPVLRPRASQFLFPEREIADAVPWSRASQCRSLVARWLILFPETEFANSCSLIAR